MIKPVCQINSRIMKYMALTLQIKGTEKNTILNGRSYFRLIYMIITDET
jgi:hypothetical protein